MTLDVESIRTGRQTGERHASQGQGADLTASTRWTSPAPSFFYSRKLQTDRWIAGARVALVACPLVAAWLYPMAPSDLGLMLHRLLGMYAVYATGLLVLTWVAPAPLPYPVARHIIDVTVTSAMLYFSLGVSSPLFPYAACLLVVGMMFAAATSLLLPKLGTYIERGRQDMQDLAAEPELAADDPDALIRQLPPWAARVLGAPRALIAWEEPEEPWLCLASFSGGSARYSQEPPDVIEPMVPSELTGGAFFCRRLDDAPRPVIYRSSGEFKRWYGSPLNPVLRERFGATSVLSVRSEE